MCRLLCVEHVEEHKKPVLYLVSISIMHWPSLSTSSEQGFHGQGHVSQVFEFLSTDLKKYMERTGKGPENPLDLDLVKVSPATPYARTAHLPLCTEAPSAC